MSMRYWLLVLIPSQYSILFIPTELNNVRSLPQAADQNITVVIKDRSKILQDGLFTVDFVL